MLEHHDIDSATGFEVARGCTVAASLLHDLGKISAHFQDKLEASTDRYGSDYARHELISGILFYRLIEDQVTLRVSEARILEELADATTLVNRLDKALKKPLFEGHHHASSSFVEMNRMMSEGDAYPVLGTIFFLIVTHHKLPDGYAGRNGSLITMLSAHINEGALPNVQVMANQRLAKGKKQFFLERGSEYVRQLSTALKALSHAVQDNPISECYLLPYSALHSRVCLILSDRFISSQATVHIEADPSLPEFYANTVGLAGEDYRAQAQTLESHLLDVATQASFNCGLLHSLVTQTLPLPSTQHGYTPQDLDMSANGPSRFSWQGEMASLLRRNALSACEKGVPPSTGFFAVMVAGTGTGKTRAGLKLLATLSNTLRFTVAVPFRSLAHQTYREYTQHAKVQSEDVGLLIGGELNRESGRLPEDASPASGTDASLEDSVEGYFADPLGEESDWQLEGLTECLKAKERRMIGLPVLVCTIDHLMGVSDMTKGRHLAASLRVMTSDLVIDEVDSFSESDLVAIGKLVYRAGMSGKKVILSSATLSPLLAISLQSSYQRGYAVYAAMTGERPTVMNALFSEYRSTSDVFLQEGGSGFSERYQAFMESVSLHASMEPTVRKGGFLSLKECEGNQEAYARVLSSSRTLHQSHSGLDPSTDVRVSVGMVKWGSVRDAVMFTQYLVSHEASTPTTYKVLCYHARQRGIELQGQADVLQGLLRREDEKAIFSNRLVREAIDLAVSRGHEDVQIIVSTTSIAETGTDYDFDYAILEPSGYRSLIQAAGRVRRHRPRSVTSENVMVLDRPIQHYQPPEVHHPPRGVTRRRLVKRIRAKMHNPKERLSTGTHDLWSLTEATSLPDIMDSKGLEKIDSQRSLRGHSDQGDILSLFEFGREEAALEGSISGQPFSELQVMSLAYYTGNKDCQVSNFHYNINPFRGIRESAEFLLSDDGKWHRLLYHKGKIKKLKSDSLVERVTVDDPHHRLLMGSKAAEPFASTARERSDDIRKNKHHAQEMRVISMPIYAKNRTIKFKYHPHLGAF